MDAREGDRYDRVAERPDPDAARPTPPLVPGDHEAPRGRPEGQDAFPARPLLAEPEEAPSRPKLEAAECAQLDLEGPLNAAHRLAALLLL